MCAYLEGVAEAPRLLESRAKHLVSSDVGVGNGSSSEPHCLDISHLQLVEFNHYHVPPRNVHYQVSFVCHIRE